MDPQLAVCFEATGMTRARPKAKIFLASGERFCFPGFGIGWGMSRSSGKPKTATRKLLIRQIQHFSMSYAP
jgi:hypothetical protein